MHIVEIQSKLGGEGSQSTNAQQSHIDYAVLIPWNKAASAQVRKPNL
jgi:hypothetical protein